MTDAMPTTSDAQPEPPLELGRHEHKGTASVMWGGVWEPLGEIEFITENGRIVEVVNYTARHFREEERGRQVS